MGTWIHAITWYVGSGRRGSGADSRCGFHREGGQGTERGSYWLGLGFGFGLGLGFGGLGLGLGLSQRMLFVVGNMDVFSWQTKTSHLAVQKHFFS